MEGTIEQRNFYVNNGIPSKYATFSGFFNAFFNWVNILFGNGPTNNLIFKQYPTSTFTRLQGKHDMAVLTFTAGLFGILVINFLNHFGDRLTKRDTWSTDICLHSKFAQ